MASLYSDFREAVRLIAKNVGLKRPQFHTENYETPKVGADYISDVSGQKSRFHCHLRTYSEGSGFTDWNSLRLSIYFYNDFDLCQFDKFKKIRSPEKLNLKQWACDVAEEYLRKKNKNELEFLFGDREIRVRGKAGITNATLIEFILNLKGYLAWGADRLLVYRFHHGTGQEKGFSYAFLIESRQSIFDYSFWCVFPTFIALTEGTSRGGYKQVESLLEDVNKKIKMKIRDIQVSEDEFLDVLREKNVSPIGSYVGYGAQRKPPISSTEFEEKVTEGPSKTGKYSLSTIPGKLENRVFIGGNYDNISVLREIKNIVLDLGYVPILALEFEIHSEKSHDYDLLLLHNCKFSIFEITVLNGHLMELERAKEYGVKTLLVFQVIDEQRTPPPTVSQMVLSLDLQHFGYLDFEELKKRISKFLIEH